MDARLPGRASLALLRELLLEGGQLRRHLGLLVAELVPLPADGCRDSVPPGRPCTTSTPSSGPRSGAGSNRHLPRLAEICPSRVRGQTGRATPFGRISRDPENARHVVDAWSGGSFWQHDETARKSNMLNNKIRKLRGPFWATKLQMRAHAQAQARLLSMQVKGSTTCVHERRQGLWRAGTETNDAQHNAR